MKSNENEIEKYVEKQLKFADNRIKKLEGIALRLRALRTKRDVNSSIPESVTLAKLAELIGDKYSNIARYEADKKDYTTRPPFEVLMKLSLIYQVPVDYILYGDYYTSATDKEIESEKIEKYQEEIDQLHKTISDKDDLINSQKMIISMIQEKTKSV